MKRYFAFLGLYLFFSFSISAYPDTKVTMPNFFNGFGESRPYPETVYSTEYGDEIVVMNSYFHGTGLYINGSINNSVTEIVSGLLEFEDIKYVFLNSNGGFVSDGLALGLLFRKNKVFTALDYDSECHSACFLAFIGGIERYQSASILFEIPPVLTMHTPYYLKNGKKTYLRRNDELAEQVCNYIKSMIPESGGKRACFETFSAKEGTIHNSILLQDLGIYTGFLSYYGFKFVKNYNPPEKSKWYGNCFLNADDFSFEDGRCGREAGKCFEVGTIYSDERVKCMNESGYKDYSAKFGQLVPEGGFIIRIQRKWELIGEPNFYKHIK